jgi:hypothetical protein
MRVDPFLLDRGLQERAGPSIRHDFGEAPGRRPGPARQTVRRARRRRGLDPPTGRDDGVPWLADGGDARALWQAAGREGILLVPGDCFGTPEHFRIGFRSQSAGFGESVGALSAFFASRAPERAP